MSEVPNLPKSAERKSPWIRSNQLRYPADQRPASEGHGNGLLSVQGQASGFDLDHCARPQPLVDFRPIGPFGLCVPLLQADEAKGEALLRIPEKASKTKKNNARNHDLTLSALGPRSVRVVPGEAASGPHDRMGDSI